MPPFSSIESVCDDRTVLSDTASCTSCSTDSSRECQAPSNARSSTPPANERPPKKIKKRVGFTAYAEVLEIHNTDDLTDDEKAAMFHSRTELKAIKRSAVAAIVAMNRHELPSDPCMRGLEKLLACNATRVRRTRYAAKEAVFGLQKLHKLKGIEVVGLIADMYATSSLPATEEARAMGMCDALDIIC